MSPIAVALVEDDERVHARLERALRSAGDLDVLATFRSGREALVWLEGNAPDVLLLDLGLPDLPGLAVLTYCARHHPRCQIVVVTVHDDPDLVVRCLEAGASGYLLKDAAGDDITHYIREVHAGGVPLTPAVARQILRRFRPATPAAQPAESPNVATLTPREQTILTRVTQGFRYAEIAQMEGISIHTVLTHVRNIHAKLGVTSRSEAIFEAMQLGLVDRALPRT